MWHVWGAAWAPGGGFTWRAQTEPRAPGSSHSNSSPCRVSVLGPGGTHHGAEGWAKKEQLSPHVCQGPPSLFSAKCAQSPILVGMGQAWRSPSSCHVPSLCFCLAAGLLGPGLSERSAEARRKAAKGEEDTAGGKLWVSQTRKEDPTLRAPTHTALLGSVFSQLWYCRGSASAPTM